MGAPGVDAWQPYKILEFLGPSLKCDYRALQANLDGFRTPNVTQRIVSVVPCPCVLRLGLAGLAACRRRSDENLLLSTAESQSSLGCHLEKMRAMCFLQVEPTGCSRSVSQLLQSLALPVALLRRKHPVVTLQLCLNGSPSYDPKPC